MNDFTPTIPADDAAPNLAGSKVMENPRSTIEVQLGVPDVRGVRRYWLHYHNYVGHWHAAVCLTVDADSPEDALRKGIGELMAKMDHFMEVNDERLKS